MQHAANDDVRLRQSVVGDVLLNAKSTTPDIEIVVFGTAFRKLDKRVQTLVELRLVDRPLMDAPHLRRVTQNRANIGLSIRVEKQLTA